MKQLLLITLVAFHFHVFSQYTFKKQYTITDNKGLSGSLLSYNGNTLIYGYEKGFSYYPAFIHYLNDSGNIVRTRIFKAADSTSTNGKTFVSSDNCLITFSGTGNVYKVNASGNVVWSNKIVSKRYGAWGERIVGEDKAGNYLVGGMVTDPKEKSVMQLFKVDKNNGRVIWQRVISKTERDATDSWYCVDVAASANGDIYVAGSYVCQECEGSNPEYIKMNDAGNNISSFDVSPTARYFFDDDIYRLIPQGNHVYALGYKYETGYYLFDLTTARDSIFISGAALPSDSKYDGGDFILQGFLNHHPALLPFQKDYITLFKKDGSLLKYSGNPLSNKDGSLTQYDTAGRVCTSAKHQSNVDTTTVPFSYFNAYFKRLGDSVYNKSVNIVSSLTDSYVTVLCETKNTNSSTTNPSLVTTSTSIAQPVIHPNPADAVVTLTYYSSTARKAAIQLYASNGAVVHTLQVQAYKGVNNQRINVQQLTPGVYFIKLTNEGRVITLSFIKN